MCSRYYVNQKLASKLLGIENQGVRGLRTGDIHPGEEAVIWRLENQKTVPQQMIWGFPGNDGKEMIINARSETALTRPTFREAALSRRCAIPASGFYEWDRTKNKVTFSVKDREFLYLAGIYSQYGEELRFVVLTTKADQTVAPVHDRMPLALDRRDAMEWLLAGTEERVRVILSMKAFPVEITGGYVQETLPFCREE